MNSIVVFEVEETVDNYIEWITSKDFDAIPYPKYGETLEQTIIRLDKELVSGL